MADADAANEYLKIGPIHIPRNPTAKQICIAIVIIFVVFAHNHTIQKALDVVAVVIVFLAIFYIIYTIVNAIRTDKHDGELKAVTRDGDAGAGLMPGSAGTSTTSGPVFLDTWSHKKNPPLSITHRTDEDLSYDDLKTRRVLICHTWEYKARFVKPLVTELIAQGVPVSARLYTCYGTSYVLTQRQNLFVFVISNRVFDNPWEIRTTYNLLHDQKEKIVPIWLGQDKEDLAELEGKLKANNLSGLAPFLPTKVKVDEIENELPYIARKIRWEWQL